MDDSVCASVNPNSGNSPLVIYADADKLEKQGIERVQTLADISRSLYAVIATKPVHRLQIRPIVHNWGHPYHSPKLHLGPCSSVGMRRGTDRHTYARDHYTFRVVYDLCEMQ